MFPIMKKYEYICSYTLDIYLFEGFVEPLENLRFSDQAAQNLDSTPDFLCFATQCLEILGVECGIQYWNVSCRRSRKETDKRCRTESGERPHRGLNPCGIVWIFTILSSIDLLPNPYKVASPD